MKKVLVFVLLLFGFVLTVDAASYNVSVGYKTLTKGGKTTLTISSSDVVGRFNVSTSNASVVNVNAGFVWVEKNSVSIELTALNVGNATITVTPTSGTSDADGNLVNLGAKSVYITVVLPREKSSNNNLKDLSIEGYEITPKFDKDTLEYTASVPSTVDKIKINASKADNYATVDGTGEFEVEEGINAFEVICTSETGVSKKYKINVMVEDKNPIEVTVDGETYTVVKNAKNLVAPDFYSETTIQIGTNTIPGFYNAKTNYKLVGLKDSAGEVSLFIYDNDKYYKYNEIKSSGLTIVAVDSKEVLNGYKLKELEINGSKIKALVVNDNSKFAVVYGINVETGEKSYYVYDIEANTISRYDDEMIASLKATIKSFSYIILGTTISTAIFALLTITFVALNGKKKKLIKKFLETNEHEPIIDTRIVEKNTKKNKKEIENIEKQIKEEKNEEPKKAKKVETKEDKKEMTKEIKTSEIKEETEVYDLFAEDRKKKKKSKK